MMKWRENGILELRLANSVLHQIVSTIADIKMHADSTLRALKLAVLLFTGTHQL